ncbi:D-alanyl-D-alanine carboxypeptidase [Clostridium carboxidivorans P7]|uniref:Peptidase M15B and M15C DD-carboxypeptidase VanY/endolysin n=1 Tax=Clostridium carboxidivorans P7 TaxID=536227 RepID=C6PRB1_9CLOT|nr:M15 family metallopeptidase [Clostridium carboxidivorans]AKN31719.1 D-alanyl-D-alanine carboxypeptidase [Clostridium carboxidivorans P7]EET88211.1 peptidase M15B and M15C DD-carboxypeptidase VanY/endolysin [Clostridium carboxidivorans P7]EFG87457.1 serine-type D-Ala-D-Ala carboxypeptidase [Clostridium carboxidivorans P7]
MKKLLMMPVLFLAVVVIIYSVFKPNQTINNLAYGSDKKTGDVLILVNRDNRLSSNDIPKNLTVPNVNFAFNTSHEEKMMQGEAARALENLFAYAGKQDINLYGNSGYRSYKSQKQIYNERVKKVGKQQADEYVAQPGASEHQTGLAMDVTNKDGAQGRLMVDFGQTREGKWLKANAYRFGFIMRYPKEKEAVTGYNYESWHIRYVGVKAAKEIFDKNLVLEEYLGEK